MTDRQTDFARLLRLCMSMRWNEIFANADDDGDNGENSDDQKHKLEASKTKQTTMNKIILSIFTILALASVSWGMEETFQRNLVMDPFWPERDVCNNSNDPDKVELGPCDFSRFPRCQYEKNRFCFNRKPSRDDFHRDNHQPKYYIQYDRVMCYPVQWGACSSCTPGRYCRSEKRCILEEKDYPCEEWL